MFMTVQSSEFKFEFPAQFEVMSTVTGLGFCSTTTLGVCCLNRVKAGPGGAGRGTMATPPAL